MADAAPSPESRAEDALEAVGEAAEAVQTCAELWGLADSNLEQAERALIEANGIKLSDLNEILEKAEAKQDEWKSSQLVFKFHGKEFKAREIWGMIVHSISKFKNFFGKVVACDPTGHAALPWAVISLVIGLLECDQNQLETVADALTTVVEVIAYYVDFEKLYENQEWQVVKNLKAAIVDVYTSILKVLCMVRGYYAVKVRKIPFASLFKSKEALKSTLSNIESGNRKVENYARLVRWEIEKNISNRVQDIHNDLHSLVFWADIETLSPISSFEEHAEYSQLRVRDTGLWLLDDEEFHKWRYSADSSLMLLSGDVGTGKSSLTSLVIDGFLDGQKLVDKQPVLYFYGKQGREAKDVLSNLVRQLLLAQSDPNNPPNLKLKGGAKLSEKACRERIEAFVKAQKSTAIIIDSLETCIPVTLSASTTGGIEKSNRYTYLNLFQDLREIMRKSPRPVKVFITCRSPSAGIESAFKADKFKNKFCLSVSKNSTDMRRVIEDEVGYWDESALLPNLECDSADNERAKARRALVDVISERAEGMFTWAILVLRKGFRDNKELITVEDVKNELKKYSVPLDLKRFYDETYRVLYAPSGSPSSQRAGRAVKLLFCAKKVLSSAAFIDAVQACGESVTRAKVSNYSTEVRTLVSSCLGWIVYDSGRDIFRFGHRSIEEYLREIILNGDQEKKEYQTNAHATMATGCLRAISAAVCGGSTFSNKQDSEDSDNTPCHWASRVEDVFPTSLGYPFLSSTISDQPQGSLSGSVDICPGTLSSIENVRRFLAMEEADSRPFDFTNPYGDCQQEVVDFSTPPPRPRRSSSASSRASNRSQSENRPQSRSGCKSSRDLEEDNSRMQPVRASSVWSVVRSLGRSNRMDVEMDNPIQDFNEYATLHWASHYQACQSVCSEYSKLEKLVDDMLLNWNQKKQRGLFGTWIDRVQKIFAQRPVGFYSEAVETELQYCIMPPATPLQVSCVYGLTRIVKELTKTGCATGEGEAAPSPLTPNDEGMTGLHMACRFGNLETVQYLATLTTNEVDFGRVDEEGKSALQYAVEATGRNLVETDQAREGFQAPNPTELVRVVLSISSSKKFQATSSVLVAAMNNVSVAGPLLKMLGIGPPWHHLHKQQKTAEVMIAAASCPFTDLELVQSVTDTDCVRTVMLCAIASSPRRPKTKENDEIWPWLLRLLPKQDPIVQVIDLLFVAEAAIKSVDSELAELLVKHMDEIGHSLFWSKDVLEIAVMDRNPPVRLVNGLLDRIATLQVDEGVLLRALRNPAVDIDLFSKLVSRTGKRPKITVPILNAVAVNRRLGAKMLQLLIDKTPYLPTSEFGPEQLDPIFLEAVAKGNVNIVKLFVDKLAFPVSSSVLPTFLSERRVDGALSAIKKKYDTIARPTFAQESQAPEDYWDGLFAQCLKLMVQKMEASETITQKMVKDAAAIHGPRVMEVLLRHTPTKLWEIKVTRHMALKATTNTMYGYALLPFFEKEGDYRNWRVDDEVLRRTARYGDLRTMSLLLGTYPTGSCSPELWYAAIHNPDITVIEYVFRRLSPSNVTMEDLRIGANTSDAAFECLLSHYGSSAKTGAGASQDLGSTIAEKCRKSKTLRLAFEQRVAPEPSTSDELETLLWYAFRNEHGLEIANFLLNRYHTKETLITIPSYLLCAAAGNGNVAPEMLRLLLNHCEDERVENVVDAQVLTKAATNWREAPEALRMLPMERSPKSFSQTEIEKIRKAIRENPLSSPRIAAMKVYEKWVQRR